MFMKTMAVGPCLLVWSCVTGCTTDAIPLVGVHSEDFGTAVVSLEAPFARDGNSLLVDMMLLPMMRDNEQRVTKARGVGNNINPFWPQGLDCRNSIDRFHGEVHHVLPCFGRDCPSKLTYCMCWRLTQRLGKYIERTSMPC